MLVLTLALEQSVILETTDGLVEIMLTERRSDGRIRLGFEAPPEVGIYRRKVWEEIQNEKREKRKGTAENGR